MALCIKMCGLSEKGFKVGVKPTPLEVMWKCKVHTDFQLKAHGGIVRCHRSVLMSAAGS